MIQSIKTNQFGVTLVELVVSIVVLAIASSAIVRLSSTLTERSADPMIQYQAIAIAESYLAEVLLKPYLDPDTGTVCPAAEASRALYDNVCDYDGVIENGARAATSPGTIATGLDDYRVTIDVVTNDSLGALSGPNEVLRVDVLVEHTTSGILGNGYTLSGYRANY